VAIASQERKNITYSN